MKHHGNHISQAQTVKFGYRKKKSGYRILHVLSPLRGKQKQATIFEDLNITF